MSDIAAPADAHLAPVMARNLCRAFTGGRAAQQPAQPRPFVALAEAIWEARISIDNDTGRHTDAVCALDALHDMCLSANVHEGALNAAAGAKHEDGAHELREAIRRQAENVARNVGVSL